VRVLAFSKIMASVRSGSAKGWYFSTALNLALMKAARSYPPGFAAPPPYRNPPAPVYTILRLQDREVLAKLRIEAGFC
jgi:hypothetical protein